MPALVLRVVPSNESRDPSSSLVVVVVVGGGGGGGVVVLVGGHPLLLLLLLVVVVVLLLFLLVVVPRTCGRRCRSAPARTPPAPTASSWSRRTRESCRPGPPYSTWIAIEGERTRVEGQMLGGGLRALYR